MTLAHRPETTATAATASAAEPAVPAADPVLCVDRGGLARCLGQYSTRGEAVVCAGAWPCAHHPGDDPADLAC